jgi:Cu/Ag efflux pump CusA
MLTISLMALVIMRRVKTLQLCWPALKEKIVVNKSFCPKALKLFPYYDYFTWLIDKPAKQSLCSLTEGAILVTLILFLFF